MVPILRLVRNETSTGIPIRMTRYIYRPIKINKAVIKKLYTRLNSLSPNCSTANITHARSNLTSEERISSCGFIAV